jgi:hypothetical protein
MVEDGGMSLEETKEMEKTRVDGFGSFSGVERFSILEVYSLF